MWDRSSFKHSDLRTVSTSFHQRVGKPFVTRLCILPEAGITFPLNEQYDKIHAELLGPRIVSEEYEPHEDARAARAPTFADDPKEQSKKEEVKPELDGTEIKLDPEPKPLDLRQENETEGGLPSGREYNEIPL